MSFTKGHKITNTGRTHWKKGRIPWNKGKIGTILKPRTGWSIVCIVCGIEKYYQLNEHKKRERVYCSLECYHKDSRKPDNELGYSAIHIRIKNTYGKADVCEECGSTKTVEWANLDHNYTLERSKWRKMCRKCHFQYDYKMGWGNALKKFPNMRY